MPPSRNSGFVATTPFLCVPETRSQKKGLKQGPLTSTLVGSMQGDVPSSLQTSLVEEFIRTSCTNLSLNFFFFLGYPAVNPDFLNWLDQHSEEGFRKVGIASIFRNFKFVNSRKFYQSRSILPFAVRPQGYVSPLATSNAHLGSSSLMRSTKTRRDKPSRARHGCQVSGCCLRYYFTALN